MTIALLVAMLSFIIACLASFAGFIFACVIFFVIASLFGVVAMGCEGRIITRIKKLEEELANLRGE